MSDNLFTIGTRVSIMPNGKMKAAGVVVGHAMITDPSAMNEMRPMVIVELNIAYQGYIDNDMKYDNKSWIRMIVVDPILLDKLP